MSDDEERDHFCDGIREGSIAGLAKISDWYVIARNSSFVYKNVARDPRHVGAEPGAVYLIDGSARRAAEPGTIANIESCEWLV